MTRPLSCFNSSWCQTTDPLGPLASPSGRRGDRGPPNTINLSAAGVIPVAIISTNTFNAPAAVNPETLTLDCAKVKVAGKSDKFLCQSQDVNHDGLPDLVCQFENELNAQIGDSIAVLEGFTTNGTFIRGQDSLSIVPDK